jgi:hypothetical protein
VRRSLARFCDTFIATRNLSTYTPFHIDDGGGHESSNPHCAARYDPASTINLGIALAKTGHPDQAADQFRRALVLDDVQIVVADGQMVMSHDVARRALAALQNGVLSR